VIWLRLWFVGGKERLLELLLAFHTEEIAGKVLSKMFALTLAHCTFTPPPLSGVAMASGRRAFLGRAFLGAATVGAATSTLVIAPLPSFAAASAQQVLKSRAVYGSRVFRLQDASTAVIMDEKNVFDLFLTGGARRQKVARRAGASEASLSAGQPRFASQPLWPCCSAMPLVFRLRCVWLDRRQSDEEGAPEAGNGGARTYPYPNPNPNPNLNLNPNPNPNPYPDSNPDPDPNPDPSPSPSPSPNQVALAAAAKGDAAAAQVAISLALALAQP
jgi:hypothetical protein